MSIRTASSGIVVSLAAILAMTACNSDPDPTAEGSSAGAAGRGAGGRAASGAASGTPMVTGGISPSLAGASAVLAGAGESAQAGAVGASGGTSGAPSNSGGQPPAGSPGVGGVGLPSAGGASATTIARAGSSAVSAGGAATGGATATGAGVGGKATGGSAVGGAGVAGRMITIAGTAGRAAAGAASGGAPVAGRTGVAGASVVAGATSGGVAGAATAGSSSTVAGAAGADQGAPSCAGGLLCQGESCCTAIEVPGGTFLRGRGTETCAAGDSCQDGCPDAVRLGSATGCEYEYNETPENSATISTFKLDKYPVTVGRMKKFLAAYNAWRLAGKPTMYSGAAPAGQETGFRTGWDLDISAAALEDSLACDPSAGDVPTINSGHDDYPINCVNWIQAYAFCIWDGGRLPTEAEWEYAAAGGAENRLYPWGSAEPDATRARFDSSDPRVSVGSYPAGEGRWEHRDMAGLVWEWVLDAYQNDYYGSAACVNCSKWTIAAGERVLRGGSYGSTAESGNLRAARRFYNYADVISTDTYGFRCAR